MEKKTALIVVIVGSLSFFMELY